MAQKVKNQQNLNILNDKPLGHWILSSEFTAIPEDAFGFVYLITNKSNNKQYIGCKMLSKIIKRAPLKGKKKKRCEKADSDWRTYTGSSTELNIDIKKLGEAMFDFKILTFAYSKSQLKFLELMYQLMNNVMFDDMFYNSMINVRLSKIKNFQKIDDFSKFIL